MNIPDHLHYTKSHEWVRIEGDLATVGISDHAQSELGDIVYLELPALGRSCRAGESIAVIESVKAASDIYAPLDGEIAEVNHSAAAESGLINSDAYGEGWLFKIKIKDADAAGNLLNAGAYRSHIGG
ncbi:MAG: glycine cleavage system protein GcvH [Verrucomicrobiales bacterium]